MKALLTGSLGLAAVLANPIELAKDIQALSAVIGHHSLRKTGDIDAAIQNRQWKTLDNKGPASIYHTLQKSSLEELSDRFLRGSSKKAAKKAKRQQKKAAKGQQQETPAPEAQSEEPVQEATFSEDIATMASLINKGSVSIPERVKQLNPFALQIVAKYNELFGNKRSLAKKSAKKARRQQKKAEKKASKGQQQETPAPETQTEEPVQEATFSEDIATMASLINKGSVSLPERVKQLNPFALQIIAKYNELFGNKRSLAKKTAKKARRQQKRAEKKAAKAQQQPEAAPETQAEEPVQEATFSEDIATMASLINKGSVSLPERVKQLNPFALQIIAKYNELFGNKKH